MTVPTTTTLELDANEVQLIQAYRAALVAKQALAKADAQFDRLQQNRVAAAQQVQQALASFETFKQQMGV